MCGVESTAKAMDIGFGGEKRYVQTRRMTFQVLQKKREDVAVSSSFFDFVLSVSEELHAQTKEGSVSSVLEKGG